MNRSCPASTPTLNDIGAGHRRRQEPDLREGGGKAEAVQQTNDKCTAGSRGVRTLDRGLSVNTEPSRCGY